MAIGAAGVIAVGCCGAHDLGGRLLIRHCGLVSSSVLLLPVIFFTQLPSTRDAVSGEEGEGKVGRRRKRSRLIGGEGGGRKEKESLSEKKKGIPKEKRDCR